MNMSGMSLNIPRLTDRSFDSQQWHHHLKYSHESLDRDTFSSRCMEHLSNSCSEIWMYLTHLFGGRKKIPREISLKVAPFILNELLKQ